jgi:lipoprotein-anchoring transpeptidase ErfK/SrfK
MNTSLPPIPLSRSATIAACATMVVALLSGCSALPKLPAQAQAPAVAPEAVVAKPAKPEPLPDAEPAKKTKLYEWTGEGRAVTRVVVNVDEQKARFYEGDKEVGWTTVASGVSKFPTPVGSYSVQEKVANKESNLYGKVYGKGGQLISSNAKVGKTPIPAGARFDGADMPYFLRLTGDGIGMHAGPIPNPGRPASHGCIRMPKAFAPIAFRHVGVGTQVSIVGKGPSYSAYLAQQRALAPRPKPATRTPTQTPTQMANQAPVAAPAAVAAGPEFLTGVPAEAGVQATAQAVASPAHPGGTVATAAAETSTVPAVAHEPVPPVAPAIAIRAESGQPPGQVDAQTPSPVAVAAPAVAPSAARVEGASAPSTMPLPAPAQAAPAAPTAVYYPAPQVPAYRASAQAPVFLPPPVAPVAAQTTAPAQPAAAPQLKTPDAPAAAEPKAPDLPAATAQPAAPAQPAAQPAQGSGPA